MPFYDFTCDKCCYKEEICRSITEKLPTKCPNCRAKSPAFHQIYGAPTLIAYGNIDQVTTFGQAAEINCRKAGKEQLQLMSEAEQARRREKRGRALRLPKGASYIDKPEGRPWWRPHSDRVLDLKKARTDPKYSDIIKDLDKSVAKIHKKKGRSQ